MSQTSSVGDAALFLEKGKERQNVVLETRTYWVTVAYMMHSYIIIVSYLLLSMRYSWSLIRAYNARNVLRGFMHQFDIPCLHLTAESPSRHTYHRSSASSHPHVLHPPHRSRAS